MAARDCPYTGSLAIMLIVLFLDMEVLSIPPKFPELSFFDFDYNSSYFYSRFISAPYFVCILSSSVRRLFITVFFSSRSRSSSFTRFTAIVY